MKRSQTVQEALDLNSEVTALSVVLRDHPVCVVRDSYEDAACSSLATHHDTYGNIVCEVHAHKWQGNTFKELPQAKMARRLLSLLKGEP